MSSRKQADRGHPVRGRWTRRDDLVQPAGGQELRQLGPADGARRGAGARRERRRRARRRDPRARQHVLRRRRPEHARLASSSGRPTSRSRSPRSRPARSTARSTSSKPTIAVVEGFAVAGGFELFISCDFAVVEDNARIGDFHIRRALFGGAGPIYRLPRYIGLRKTKELLLTGKLLSGKQCEEWGLANVSAPADGARPGGGRLHRAADRQERVHDADHQARRQPRPRRRHRDAARAREHDLQRRAPVRRTPRRACRPSSRSATRSGSTARSDRSHDERPARRAGRFARLRLMPRSDGRRRRAARRGAGRRRSRSRPSRRRPRGRRCPGRRRRA